MEYEDCGREDFGWGGDESFLDADNFMLELNEVRAMQYERDLLEMQFEYCNDNEYGFDENLEEDYDERTEVE